MNHASEISLLKNRTCIPCQGVAEPLDEPVLSQYFQHLSNDWRIIEGKRLERTFKFKNFDEALKFTNKVGQLAETLQHHPDIHLSWGKVTVKIWTHKIDGLHENDFILAAGIDHI